MNRELNLDDKGCIDPLTSMGSFFFAWIDDFILGSKGTEEDHRRHFKKLLYHINRLGLKLNIKKSFFFINILKDECSLLGFTISRGKLVPNAKKMNVISSFPVLNTRQDRTTKIFGVFDIYQNTGSSINFRPFNNFDPLNIYYKRI